MSVNILLHREMYVRRMPEILHILFLLGADQLQFVGVLSQFILPRLHKSLIIKTMDNPIYITLFLRITELTQ